MSTNLLPCEILGHSIHYLPIYPKAKFLLSLFITGGWGEGGRLGTISVINGQNDKRTLIDKTMHR